MTAKGQQSAEEIIRSCEDRILTIKKRLYYLSAVLTELNRIFKIRPGKIKNDIIYQMAIDSFDMLVIDMASLCKGMYTKGGFFNKLKIHVGLIKKRKKKDIQPPAPMIIMGGSQSAQDIADAQKHMADFFRQEIMKHNLDALKRLFPNFDPRADTKLNHDDIDALKDRFVELHARIVADRDSNRAHRYENKEDKSQKMSIEDLTKHFNELESMLNDLRLIILDSSFSYNNMNMADTERTAQDIADLVMHGSINSMTQEFGMNDFMHKGGVEHPYFWKIRENYYKDLE